MFAIVGHAGHYFSVHGYTVNVEVKTGGTTMRPTGTVSAMVNGHEVAMASIQGLSPEKANEVIFGLRDQLVNQLSRDLV